MARLFTSGGEIGELTGEGWVTSLGVPISSANPRSGTFCYRATGNGSANQFSFSGVVGTTYFLRAYFYVSALPTVLATLFQFNGATDKQGVFLNSDGTLTVGHGATNITVNPLGTSTETVAANSYFRVEIAVSFGAGAVDYVEARLNGVSFFASSTLSLSDTAPTLFFLSGSDGVITTDSDDVALNDSTGAAQNSWPGDGKIVLLKPISDNARGTGWVNDANGATNFFDATDNTPPVGIAQTTASTGLHQIQNATSNANSSYDANLTTYTTAGIAAADTVNVVVPVVATGAPVVTSAKAGTYGIVSNPAIANVSLGAGGTSGAFWSGTTAGTYPTGWKWSFGTTTYAPSVTKGNSPVARITQVTSSTRIAMVCAMGVYVDYTPALARRELLLLQSVKRGAFF